MRFSPDASFLPKRCTGCGICRDACPSGAVTIHGDLPRFEARLCIGCGHCGAWCPENCHDLEPAPAEPPCSPESFALLAASRRSMRSFAPGEIPEEDLGELLSVVACSPTGVNAQGIAVLCRKGGAVRTELFEPFAALLRRLRPTGIPWLAGRLSGKGRYLDRILEGEDLVFREAPLVLFFFVPRRNPTCMSDGVIAAATVMHQATAMGLGTLWNGVARAAYPLLGRWRAGAPRGCRLTAVLCVGRPAARPRWLVPPREWKSSERF